MGKVYVSATVLVGALAAWGLWISEVRWIKGWAGLAWLSGFNWSAIPICGLIAVVATLALAEKTKPDKRIVPAALSLFLLSLSGFAIARWSAFELFSGGLGSVGVRPVPLAALLLSALLVCVGFTAVANRWLAPMRYWTAALLALAIALVVPLSVFTIKFLPALNGSVDEIHAIKMGYPVFWTALLLPLALLMGRKRLS